ncbi:MAG: hypothetical protein K1X79_03110 [Oligoflexia bacterium]|nr:hypothetical protein [Oligoflexia bacterium]
MVREDFLAERARAEDIILGSLGFGEEASIVSVEILPQGFRGLGRWQDGETFDFESNEELTDLESWALKILAKTNARAA